MKKIKGFSLIEMLVVISIILVLVALLLPMALRIEDSVNLMIDINNFRSIYQAMYDYAEDNKGHIPHHQATKELGYYACWDAAQYWKAKLGNIDRGRYIGCSGHSSAGYADVLSAYKAYTGNYNVKSVFNCHSPKVWSYQDHNYSFRTSNSCGAHGGDGPPGGWIIGTHNPKATIVSDGSINSSWIQVTPDTKKSPFNLVCSQQYTGKKFYMPWRHMANKYPRLRLDGTDGRFRCRRQQNQCRKRW